MFGISEKIYNFVLYIKNKMIRKKPVKKDPSYMLFIFGDFDESETLTQELSAELLTVISSPFLKFTYGEYGIVFHFRSNETFLDLKVYIDMVFNQITDQYFLLEVGKNVDVKMPKKLKKDFLNIDGDLKREEPKLGGFKVDDLKEERKKDFKNIAFDIFLPIFDPQSQFNAETPVNIVEPSVDDILDKISEKGIDTLTEKEKEILENYGKRKNGGH